jgi:hypothetical protein
MPVLYGFLLTPVPCIYTFRLWHKTTLPAYYCRYRNDKAIETGLPFIDLKHSFIDEVPVTVNNKVKIQFYFITLQAVNNDT